MEQSLLVRMVGQTLQKRKDNAVQIVGAMKRIVRLLHLVSVDHLLDHHTANRTSLSCSQVAVIALLQVDAHFLSGLHLELVQSLAGAGDDRLIRIVGTRHDVASPCLFVLLDWESEHIFAPGRFYMCSNFCAFRTFRPLFKIRNGPDRVLHVFRRRRSGRRRLAGAQKLRGRICFRMGRVQTRSGRGCAHREKKVRRPGRRQESTDPFPLSL